MLFKRQFLWFALASISLVGLGNAQSTTQMTITSTSATADSTTSSSSKSTSTGEVTHTISVGPKSSPHAYVPHTIKANPGDTVVFEFYPTNHSVVKADYGAPCVPADEGVFYSGAFEDFDDSGPAPTWSVVINDTRPTFFYCTAIGSCIDNGMIGVINPNSSQTFQSQYSKALSYPYMLVPGQDMPAEGSDGTDSGSDSSSDSGSSGGGGLSKGAIAGIAVAGVVFIGILVALFFLLGRNRVYKKWMSSEDGRNERTARWAMFNNTNGGGTDVASNPGKPPMTDTTSVTGPDYNRYSAVSPRIGESAPSQVSSSPQPSGHWSWDPSLNARVHGPSELDATNSIHQLPEMSNER